MVWKHLSNIFASSEEPAKKLEIKVPPQTAEEEKILQILEQALNDGATTLHLSGQNLTKVPPEIGQLTQLTALYLYNNELHTLPPEIGLLENLAILAVWKNQLRTLPREIGKLSNLSTLLLWDNQLTEVPSEMSRLTNLQRLDLRNNPLPIQHEILDRVDQPALIIKKIVPYIYQVIGQAKFDGATELHLSEKKLTTVPPEIGQLTKLTRLYLWNNQLRTLPPEIGQLTNLIRLQLYGNQLTTVPPEIEQLTNLKILYLHNNQLTTLPSEIEKLTNLTQLSISRNQFSILPIEIAELSMLTWLNIGDNQLKTLPPEIGQLSNLRTLYLYNNQLRTLPSEISRLSDLTELDLSNNQFSYLPPEIAQLSKLSKLDLRHNNLTTLPAEIAKLTSLTKLNLRHNNLTTLPAEIVKLANLTTLDLRNNALPIPADILREINKPATIIESYHSGVIKQAIKEGASKLNLSQKGLTKVSPEISQLSHVTEIDLSNNQLSSLPPEISQLTDLTTLKLSNNQFSRWRPEIGGFIKLTTLDLSNNKLSRLPQKIRLLTQLTTLNLSNNQLSRVSAKICLLTQLTTLNLSNNQLSTLPAEIRLLTNLSTLDLRGNPLPIPLEVLEETHKPLTIISSYRVGVLIEQAFKEDATTLNLSGMGLTKVAAEIGQLTKLKTLNLSNNQRSQLTSLTAVEIVRNQLTTLPPEIGQLTDLTTLDLSDNKLSTLPPEIRRLTNLKTLDLRGNPLPIPPEILERTDEPAMIIQYYLNTRKKPLNEAKLVLVGQGGVGKTSLVKRLVSGEFDQNEAKTEGINIDQWGVTVDGESIRVNVWDFGGQEIMHATHQFFLTKRALYLLVLDARQGQVASRLDYWLKLVTSFAANSPIIVVSNKIDQHRWPLNESELRRTYPTIKAFVGISCMSGEGLRELAEEIALIIGQLPHVRDEIPLDWLAVKAELEGVAKDHLAYTDYVQLCEAKLISDEAEQRRLSRLLHDLGVVLNFQDDPRLKDTTVLNPSWVTDGVYQILNSTQVLQNQGLLEIGQLDKILHKERYPRGKHLFLIDMMRKFELCFDLEGHTEELFLLPDLLPATEPEFDLPVNSQNFEYHYDFLPSSVISRVMVRLHRFIFQDKHWRNGMVLVHNKNNALLKAMPQEKKIMISISGQAEGRAELWTIIHEHFEQIHAQITGLKAKANIVVRGKQEPICANCGTKNQIKAKFCLQCGTALSDVPTKSIEYDFLLNLQQQGYQQYPMQIGNEIVNVQVSQLLFGINPAPQPAEPEEIVAWKKVLSPLRLRLHPEKYYSVAFLLGQMYYEHLDDYTLARQALMDGHEAIEALRSLVQKEQTQQDLSKKSVQLYQMLVSCYLEEGDESNAFEYATVGKGRAFVNKLADAGVKMEAIQDEPDFGAKLEQVRQIRYQIDASERESNVNKRREQQDLLLRQEGELWQEMKRDYPALSATLSIPSLSAQQACHLAEALDATLLEFYHHADGWCAFVVTADQIRYVRLPTLTKKLLKRLIGWRNQVHLPAASRFKHLSDLYKAAIAPLGSLSTQQLIIAPFGELHLLPLAAAYNQPAQSYLTEQHVLSFVPSLTALYVLNEEHKRHDLSQKPMQKLLSVAYPGQVGEKNYLPNVLSEAEAIVERVSKMAKVQVDSLYEEQATPSNVLEKASDYDLIHFACHGDFDPDNPHDSGLLLAGSPLTVQEIITKLDLERTRLVTLAACLSGKVALQAGEEHIGLLQAMMTAGSKAVVASLWNVDDAATRALFTAFYSNPAHLNDPAEAMGEAVALVRQKEQWAHPYYWAAFTVNGLSVRRHKQAITPPIEPWQTIPIPKVVDKQKEIDSLADLLEQINQDYESSIQRGASMNEEGFVENAKLLLEYMVFEYPNYTLAALKHIKLSDEMGNLDVANNEHGLAEAIHHLVLNNPYLQKKLLPSMRDVQQVQSQLKELSQRGVHGSLHIEDAKSAHYQQESAQVKNKVSFVRDNLMKRLETEIVHRRNDHDEDDDPTETLWARFKGMIWGGRN